MNFTPPLIPLIGVFLFATTAVLATDAGSFFGNSFARAPAPTVSTTNSSSTTTTTLSFRLKTPRANCLLLVVAGSVHYLLLLLQNGVVKVRISLGSGESELSAPDSLRVDDLVWHEVRLEGRAHQMTLTIDGLITTSTTLKEEFENLRTEYGTFIGGLGGFSQIFLGFLDNYLGCFYRMRFNGINLLSVARARSTVGNVRWHCSDQFDAEVNTTASFVDQGAHAVFAPAITTSGSTMSLKLRTKTSNFLLLYSGSEQKSGDTFRVFVQQGVFKLSLLVGNQQLSLASKIRVDDGSWHRVVVTIRPQFLELSVDQTLTSTKPDNEITFISFVSNFYLGGRPGTLSNSYIGDVNQHDLNFIGCIQDIYINNRLRGFPDMLEMRGLRTGCILDNNCSSPSCSRVELCESPDEACDCEIDRCSSRDHDQTVFSDSGITENFQFLTMHPIRVLEGDKATLTFENVQLILDIKKYGIHESGVYFNIVESPSHGRLTADIWRRPDESIFTYEHLLNGYIHYLHSGSETKNDVIVLEMNLITSAGFKLPYFLEKSHKFVLPVQVIPTNDAPKINSFPDGHTLRVAKGVPRIFGPEIINAIDDDTDSDHLVYEVNVNPHTVGYFENIKNPGNTIHSFTQAQVDKGVIAYVQENYAATQLSLQVSDGISVSNTVDIRVVAYELKTIPVNNTGLTILFGHSAVITDQNLSFTTNALNSHLDVNFMVIKQPSNGRIEKLRGNGHWLSTSHFSMKNIQNGFVRYQHTLGYPDSDSFSFRVALNKIIQQGVYQFRITFLTIAAEMMVINDLLLNQTYQRTLSRKNLAVDMRPVLESYNISYEILSTPSFGDLLLLEGQPARHSLLFLGDTFTQRDVDKKRIMYRLHQKSHSAFVDEFKFRLTFPKSSVNVYSLKIHHIPSDNNGATTLRFLNVNEGGEKKLTSEALSLNITSNSGIFCNISSRPKHGAIRVLNAELTSVEIDDASHFSLSDLQSGRVTYVHDDSESPSDEFQLVSTTFTGTASSVYGEEFRVIDVRVHVHLLNDNEPIRISNRPLYVVRKGRKLVDKRVLSFVDPDLFTKPPDLVYTMRQIENGRFYKHPDYSTSVFTFSQAEIDNDLLVFEHRGQIDETEALFWITDGAHYTTGVLSIVASEPFIRIKLSSDLAELVVPRGGVLKISENHLIPETNLEVSDDSIIFEVNSPWQHGALIVEGRHATKFSYQDLKAGKLQYQVRDEPLELGRLDFVVSVGTLRSNGSLFFKVLADSYWEPLTIMHNETALVNGKQGIETITQSHLLIMHPGISADQVIYTVTKPPKYGVLLLNKPFSSSNTQFSQAAINDGNITYVLSYLNATQDMFEFSVSNSVIKLERLLFRIEMIPQSILLVITNITVSEGASLVLPHHCLHIASPYYRRQLINFRVQKSPSYGRFTLVDDRKKKVERFSETDLKAGKIIYVHSGAEAAEDCVTIVAHTASEQSTPAVLCLHVVDVNDNVPKLSVRRSLDVYTSGTALLTSDIIDVEDDDRPENDLVIHVTQSECGQISLTDPSRSSKTEVTNFTRSHMITGGVMFRHRTNVQDSGSSSNPRCYIRLYATDGLFRTAETTLTVNIHSLGLRMVNNHIIEVFPHMNQPIRSERLRATTNDPFSGRTIEYLLKKQPLLGSLTRKGPEGDIVPIKMFTQEDIDQGVVCYNHSSKLDHLEATDTFHLLVQTPAAKSLPEVLVRVVISLKSMGSGAEFRSETSDDETVHVREGGTIALGAKNFNMVSLLRLINEEKRRSGGDIGDYPYVTATVTSIPKHGSIQESGKVMEQSRIGRQLDQKSIIARRVLYRHDNSETLNDSCSYSLTLFTSTGAAHSLYNGTLLISVEQVNDQPPQLLTSRPELTVVQKQTTTITAATLETTDADTEPFDIVYNVLQRPTLGRLTLKAENSGAEEGWRIPSTVVVENFTQADLNAGRLSYVHEGSLGKDQVAFEVSDQLHHAIASEMTIKVTPLSLNITKEGPIRVKQGNSRAILTSDSIAAGTNGRRRTISFEIILQPSHGRLFMNTSIVSAFTQADIDAGLIHYLQMDMRYGTDFFRVNIYNEYNSIRNVTFAIAAEPQVMVQKLYIVQNTTTVITLKILDASQLAFNTKSNPTYRVIESPRYGHFIQKRESRQLQNQAIFSNITTFTHQDILQKNIYFVSYYMALEGGKNPLPDRVQFVLSADKVQPAQGSLAIQIVDKQQTLSNNSEPGTNSVLDREHETNLFSFVHSDYVQMTGLVIGVLITSILFMIAARCVGKSRRRQQPKRHQLQLNVTTSDRQDKHSDFTLEAAKESEPSLSDINLEEINYLNSTLPSPTEITGTLPRTGLLRSSTTNFRPMTDSQLWSASEGCSSSVLPRHGIYAQRMGLTTTPSSTVTLRRGWPNKKFEDHLGPVNNGLGHNRIATLPHCTVTPLFVAGGSVSPPLLPGTCSPMTDTCPDIDQVMRNLDFYSNESQCCNNSVERPDSDTSHSAGSNILLRKNNYWV